MKASSWPRIERFKIENYRALRAVELDKLTPFTVLLGPNGSGKSTVFDAFAFLAECFEGGLRRAWEKRGKARELKSRGIDDPVRFEIAYREERESPLITYHMSVDEKNGRPVVVSEWLRWKRGNSGVPFKFLEYENGKGRVISGTEPESKDQRIDAPLNSDDILAVNALGQMKDHPRVPALRDFIMGWHVSHHSPPNARGLTGSGPEEHLSKTGDNLGNVIQHLSAEHPEVLECIFHILRKRIPKIESVAATPMQDGRLLLQFKDYPFSDRIMARFASEGTLKMLAFLVLLHDPDPPPFICIEEPENNLHPRLMHELAEEYREASSSTQILATTHSPFFVNALRIEEVRLLWRDDAGYSVCKGLTDNGKVKEFMDSGAELGDLWMEGHFGVGDPLDRGGFPAL